jgi:hypothetical protein
MAGFISQLLERPDTPSTRLSRYTERCGFAYLAFGLCFLFWPTIYVDLGLTSPFQGQEEGMARVIGVVLAIIGYFYVFGGRTHQTSFGLATIPDRLLIPLLFAFIYVSSEIDLMLLLPFAILDPTLALGAYYCWRLDQGERGEQT